MKQLLIRHLRTAPILGVGLGLGLGLVAILALLVTACGPRLKPGPAKIRAFRSTRACSQGPFVVNLRTTSSRWGEKIVVQAWTRHTIAGRYDISVGGQVVSRGTFGKRHWIHKRNRYPAWSQVHSEGPDNRRCVAAAGARAATPAPSAPGGSRGPAGSGGASPSPAPSGKIATPPARAVVLFAPLSAADHQARLAQRPGFLRYDLIDFNLGKVAIPDYPFCATGDRHKISQSLPIRIRLWSETPNDMEDAWIEVRQSRFKPTVSEPEFVKYLAKKRKSCLAKSDRKARKERRRAHKHHARRRPFKRLCRYRMTAHDGKVRYYKLSPPKECGCFKKVNDVKCWGRGGRNAAILKFRAEFKRHTCQVEVAIKQGGRQIYGVFVSKPCRCAHDLADKSCWGAGGYAAFARAHRAARLADKQRRLAQHTLRLSRQKRDQARRRLMAQPPPLPKAEKRTPRPSRNARWVPGYWVRIKGGPAAGRWGWIAGWWRVPQTDVSRGLTARTRRRPPARRKMGQRPAKPTPRAVWAAGYWHWTGRRHVWVHGAWRIPPRGQLRWRPARWIRRGPFLILVPGGWIR